MRFSFRTRGKIFLQLERGKIFLQLERGKFFLQLKRGKHSAGAMQSQLDSFRRQRRLEDSLQGASAVHLRGGMELPLSSLSRLTLTSLQDALTIMQRATYDPSQPPAALQFYQVTETHLILPRAFGYSRALGAEIIEHRTDGLPLSSSAFVGELSPLQETAFERSYQDLSKEPHCCMLTLPCGFGKTVVALRVARAIGKRTLVVVHKEFLLSQWSARIRQFLPGAEMTILQGSRPVAPEADFVLAMLQTLCLRLSDPSSSVLAVVSACGLAIIDEAHHMAARYFSKLFFHLHVKRLLGLTATPHRKDGCTRALHMFMGQHSFLLEDSGTQRVRPKVEIVVYASPQRITCDLSAGQVQKLKTTITLDELRNELVCDIILKLAKQRRQIICLSDRTAHLKRLLEMFEEKGGAPYKPALYIGGQRRPERERVELECGVLFGTFAMAQEGLDIERLDTLILASPASDITQAVGRILRPCSSKKPPLIIDIQDDTCFNFKRQNQIRQRFYAKHSMQSVADGDSVMKSTEKLPVKRLRCS